MHSDGAEAGGKAPGSGSQVQGKGDQQVIIRRLSDDHRIAEFKCTAKAKSSRVQDFFLKHAVKYDRSNFARVFVVSPPGDEKKVWGYYTLSAGVISYKNVQLSGSQQKRVPGHIDFPVAKLGYMGKADDCTESLGGDMVLNAAQRLSNLEALGVWGIVLDAELGDPTAEAYVRPDPAADKLVARYRELGFQGVLEPEPTHTYPMYAKLDWILDALKAS